jgi:hypothetical protein
MIKNLLILFKVLKNNHSKSLKKWKNYNILELNLIQSETFINKSQKEYQTYIS